MYGNPNAQRTLYFTLTNLKKEAEKITMSVYDNTVKDIIDHCQYVEGKLTNVVFGTGEYEGRPYQTCIIHMIDENENVEYRIKCGFDKITGLTRAILNRLCTAQNFDRIAITVFGEKGDYKNVKVESNEVILKYAFEKEFLKSKTIDTSDSQGVVVHTDYTELNNFMIEQTKNLILPNLNFSSSNNIDKNPSVNKNTKDLPLPTEEPDYKPQSDNIDCTGIKSDNAVIDLDSDDLPF